MVMEVYVLNEMKQENVRSVVFTGFFAAVVFLGIQAFRIPMPAAVGTPFLHFGHIFVVLGVLCLGPKQGMAAVVIGYVLFDILNGYVHAIPNVVITAVINCLVTGNLFLVLRQKVNGNKRELRDAAWCALVYGVLNIVLDFVWSTVELVIAGSSMAAAAAAVIGSIPATVINSGFMVIGVAVLYWPVRNVVKRVGG